MLEIWPVIILGAVVAYTILRYRETFTVKYGNPMDGEDIISFDKAARGRRLFATTPDDSCPRDKEQSGLMCYPPCRPNYTGGGPVCTANTFNRGVGRPVGLEPCNPGWTNDGLICREPITCDPIRRNPCKFRGLFGECWPGLDGGTCRGGRLQGRLNGGGICDHPDKGNLPSWLVDKTNPKKWIATHPIKVDGLCYMKCPEDKPDYVAGMPYLCFNAKFGPYMYGRGAGEAQPLVGWGPKTF